MLALCTTLLSLSHICSFADLNFSFEDCNLSFEDCKLLTCSVKLSILIVSSSVVVGGEFVLRVASTGSVSTSRGSSITVSSFSSSERSSSASGAQGLLLAGLCCGSSTTFSK